MVLFIFFSSHIAQFLSQRRGRYQRPLTSQPRRRRAGPLNPYLHRSHPSQRNETLKHVASTLVMPLLDRIQVLFSFFPAGKLLWTAKDKLNLTLPSPNQHHSQLALTTPVTKSNTFTLRPASSQSTTIRLSCHRRWRGAFTLHTAHRPALLALGLVFLFVSPFIPLPPFRPFSRYEGDSVAGLSADSSNSRYTNASFPP